MKIKKNTAEQTKILLGEGVLFFMRRGLSLSFAKLVNLAN